MDVATIRSGLPAAIVSAVSGDPQGLAASSQVYLAEKRRPMPDAETIEAWVFERPEKRVLREGNAFAPRVVAYDFECHFDVDDETGVDWTSWADAMTTQFGTGVGIGSVTGLMASSVSEMSTDLSPGDGPGKTAQIVLTFTGTE